MALNGCYSIAVGNDEVTNLKRVRLALVFSLVVFAMPVAAAPAIEIPFIRSLTGGGAFLGKQVHEALTIAEKLIDETGGIHGATPAISRRADRRFRRQRHLRFPQVTPARPVAG
jgi:hypothetical protein